MVTPKCWVALDIELLGRQILGICTDTIASLTRSITQFPLPSTNLLLTRESSVDFLILTYERKRIPRRPMADDMISKLPDVLIQQILSSLPLDEAVKTSILSKRWEFLWTLSPNLVFDYLYNEEGIKFVERALFLRESTGVHKFSISFHHTVSPDVLLDCAILLRKWITDIVRLHVEDLHLDFSFFGDSVELPHCLFTCGSLTSFRLFVGWDFTFPHSINLSNLKNLVLDYVHFIDPEIADNLCSGCPMLETASLVQCAFECDCRISAPKLYKLVIKEPQLSTAICTNIMIFEPSLKSFELSGLLTNFYSFFNNQPYLDEAVICIKYGQGPNGWEGLICRLYKLLKGLFLVKKLSLSSLALEALGHQGNLLAEVPIFNNLSILSFVYGGTIGHFTNDNDNYIGLMKILQNSPCLETLHFETSIILSADYEEYERTLNLVPPCYLPSLKTLEIVYENNDDYTNLFMNTAQILLERTYVLEKFILYAR